MRWFARSIARARDDTRTVNAVTVQMDFELADGVAALAARLDQLDNRERAYGERSTATVGALLRELRADAGLSVRRLAERSTTAPSTVIRLEAGRLVPRWTTLNAIAGGLDPDLRPEILERLVAAAGPSIAPESEAWRWYRSRRLVAGVRVGRVPIPLRYRRSVLLHAAADSMVTAAMALCGLPGARDDIAISGIASALVKEAHRLSDEGGIRVVGCVPPRRWRGDPVDASPIAPPVKDLAALRRWLREWQVRQGRVRPRSNRERAIAAAGARERDILKDAEDPSCAAPGGRRAHD